MYNFVHLGRFSSVSVRCFTSFPSMGFLWIVVAVAFMDSENILSRFSAETNVSFESSFHQMISEIYKVIFFSGSGGWEKGGGRWTILNCYLKNRLRFHWSFVQILQQNPFQFRIHKTPSERHRARNKFGYSKKNVSEECFTVNTAKKRRRRRTNLHKEPEKWLMFLSLLFASPSRLICLSRQTHQQLFFRGDRLLNTLLEHTLKRTRREITRNSLETKKSIKNY